MDKRTLLLVAGFFTFTIGFLSLVLMLIGLDFQFMTWLNSAGMLTGFILRIFMVLGGIIMAAWSRTDWEQEDGLY
jgi:hypothetical protein